MPRPQFTPRVLLVAMLVVAAYLGGIQFERERQQRKNGALLEEVESRERWDYRRLVRFSSLMDEGGK